MLKRASAFIAGLLLNSLVLSTLILSNPNTAAACPDEPPKTLLQLYKSSDTIFIAKFAKTEKGELVEKDENYKVYPLKKYFDVSRTLKGDAAKIFVLEEEEYVYESAETQPVAEHEVAAEHADEGEEVTDGEAYTLEKGDTVMLFLKKDQENPKKLVLADYGDAVKKLSAEHLKTYEKRVRELNSIFGGKQVDDAKIVAWLVRCAEDPVTRWEGTFELMQAFENVDWEREQEKQKVERGATESEETSEESEVVESNAADVEIGSVDMYNNAVYAKLLTDQQKQALSGILLSLDNESADEKRAKFRKGDLELVEVVKRWGDGQVASLMIDKLRSGGYTADENVRMMAAAAKVLNDAQLAKLADEYNEVAWGDDDAEVEQYDETADTAAGPTATKGEKTGEDPKPEGEADRTGVEGHERRVNKPKADGKKKATYREERARITATFLGRAEVVRAQKERILAARH